MENTTIIKDAMSILGKKSAKKRDRQYYVDLANKRWNKAKKRENTPVKIGSIKKDKSYLFE